ncbi:alpha/beta hydrolase [Herminiimonas contaminans]|uniref:Alpha/beta hydrolase n=1 Tax=Herminiimonas contaminans TaxID=1111140 RepID=A0ABS0EU11_9BURK|nr:alpha/beta hydrolase [Herminiimonas contaminans]MBF8178329.1 alpha/beta hydrolase [Herminiimonas contaminans]
MKKKTLALLTATALLGGLIGCAPLTVINALTSSRSYVKTADIAFGTDARQRLDVYVPRDLQGSAAVVVFFYGGSWNSGNRADYAFVGEALAARGIIAVVADYRLYPQVRYPDFVDDAALALAWTVKDIQRFGGDPKRLFVMGHSAGAYNAAMVALDPRWLGKQGLTPAILRGWIGLAGPYDFIPIENPDVKPVFFFPDTPPESQPINHVTRAAPPALLIASHDDKIVNPLRNTAGLAKQLRSSGVEVTELYFDRTSHASLIATMSWPLRGLAPVLDNVERFVKSDAARENYASQQK